MIEISETRYCDHGLRFDDYCQLCEREIKIEQNTIIVIKNEISDRLKEMAVGNYPVPDELKNVPYVAMLAIANWINPEEKKYEI